MPRLLPQDVVQRCRRRPLPSCQAECVLNVTRILMNGEFRVKQAIKVMFARVPNNTVAWNLNIEQAINKCYDLQVKNVFYLQYVAQNLISTQCIPSSIRFIECTFSIVYRVNSRSETGQVEDSMSSFRNNLQDCPYQYWNFDDELCAPFVTFLNNCDYLFHSFWDI
uniref:Uncharacterized protein n=1 Tax=Anopheles dirus TaxID=7168 RepID=A0A9I3EI20_9DIPT